MAFCAGTTGDVTKGQYNAESIFHIMTSSCPFQEMDLYILDPGVLGISTLFRADLLASNPDHSNHGRRHDAYRQFLLWRHGFLAEGIDRIIPSCVTWRIRNEYPSADGKYAGFVPHRFVWLKHTTRWGIVIAKKLAHCEQFNDKWSLRLLRLQLYSW